MDYNSYRVCLAMQYGPAPASCLSIPSTAQCLPNQADRIPARQRTARQAGRATTHLGKGYKVREERIPMRLKTQMNQSLDREQDTRTGGLAGGNTHLEMGPVNVREDTEHLLM